MGLDVLVVNAGSTSLKLSLVGAGGQTERVEGFVPADAVGHRIVHMGDLAAGSALVDDALVSHIERGAEVAPLHNRPALAALRRAREALPDVPHVAVSDSEFHRTISEEARRYALPSRWSEVVRLGFHGLAVESVVEQVHASRVVVCHLGGGCSVTAVRDGRSVDTSMGYTPLEGPPMGTRSGSVDPGALLYLLRSGVGIDELDRVLNEESGLAALGGLDVLAFSGGIGENRADVRETVAGRLGHVGAFDVLALPAREDAVIARHVRALLAQ